MAYKLEDLTNVIAPSAPFTKGRMRDDDGSRNGTPVNEQLLGDMTQFFAKLMTEASITPNGNADDQTTNQIYEALINTPRIWEGQEQNPPAVFNSADSYWTLDLNKKVSQFITDPRNNSSGIGTINMNSSVPLGTEMILINDTLQNYPGFISVENPNVSKEIRRADASSSDVDFDSGQVLRIIEYTEAFIVEIM